MLATQIKRLRCLTSRPVAPGANDLIRQLESELNEYFRGERRDFDVPLRISGTDFQTAVWRQLLQIPPGETRSYDDIARAVGNAGAARAVGRANGDNRIAILIPCHRVIRSDGTLSGYGGGVWRKKRLLDLEARSAVPA
ncbi:MAG: methylated-DNA--[protein]-cysteine S-methyltransferase [Gemmatimonadales bacterium]